MARKKKSASDLLFFWFGFYIDIIVIIGSLLSEAFGSKKK